LPILDSVPIPVPVPVPVPVPIPVPVGTISVCSISVCSISVGSVSVGSVSVCSITVGSVSIGSALSHKALLLGVVWVEIQGEVLDNHVSIVVVGTWSSDLAALIGSRHSGATRDS